MNVIDRATILHFHRHRIAVYGHGSVASLGWRDEQSQRARFEVIARSADFTRTTVLDLGCGRGDLCAFLQSRFEAVRYLGVDHVPEFIHTARERYGHRPDTRFCESDFDAVELPVVDHVVASGALSYRCADAAYPHRMIRRMFAAARDSVIFNMLDARTFPEHPLLVGHDLEETAAFCRTLTPHVTVVAGYRDDDFTVCMRRSAAEASDRQGASRSTITRTSLDARTGTEESS